MPQLVGHVTRVRRDHKLRNPDSQSLSFRATLMALLRGDAARVGATESAPSTSAAATLRQNTPYDGPPIAREDVVVVSSVECRHDLERMMRNERMQGQTGMCIRFRGRSGS